MAPAKKSAKSGKPAPKPVSKGGASAPKAAKKDNVKAAPKTIAKPKTSKATKEAPKKGAVQPKVTAKKPAAPAKPVAVKQVVSVKVAAPAKKKSESDKKPVAPVKGKKEDVKVAASKAKAAAHPEKPHKVGTGKPIAVPVKGHAPTAKVAHHPEKPAKVEKAAKVEKPPKVEKAPKAPKPPKVPRVKSSKPPLARGPMEKAQRSLAATAARAAAKDKVPPSKAMAAVKAAATKTPIIADVRPVKKSVKAFFQEVAVGAERVIKRGDKTTVSPVPVDIQNRRRGGGGEESPEELVERIERELEHQHIFKRNMLRPQLCTKCGLNSVSERFTIDKELGYCDDCAEILHLGETKEARKIDFHPTLMKKDGEGAAIAPSGDDDEDEDDDDEDASPKKSIPDIDI